MKLKKIACALGAVVMFASQVFAAEYAAFEIKDNYVVLDSNAPMQPYTNLKPSPFTENAGSLNFVYILNGVTNVGANAFTDCVNLGDAAIPLTVTSIGSQAFAGAEGLKSVVIPYGVKEINSYAFTNCTSLTDVYIPDTVVSIGESAFYGCPNLTIHASENSFAAKYAAGDNVKFSKAFGEQNIKVDVLDNVKIIINGKTLDYEYPIIMRNDMTLLPLRAIFEAAGCDVSWDGEQNKAIVEKSGRRLEFAIGSDRVVTESGEAQLSCPTALICSNTSVHVRAVEMLGMKVDWDGQNQTITITY